MVGYLSNTTTMLTLVQELNQKPPLCTCPTCIPQQKDYSYLQMPPQSLGQSVK